MNIQIISILTVIAACLSPLRAQQPSAEKRPIGVPNDATQFNGKWYRAYVQRKTAWNTAKEQCEQLGGQLATVHDAATQAFISKLANGLALWLGATDEKVEALWVWVDGTPMDFKAWFPGEPNGYRKANYMHTWRDGRWADSSRTGPVELTGFICEWKAK